MSRRGVVVTLLLSLTLSPHLFAHPTATSFVIVSVTSARTATVDITTDARSLLLKLETFGGEVSPASTLTPAERRARIERLLPVLIDHVALLTDQGKASLGRGTVMAANGDAQRVHVALTASLPESVHTLRWQSSLFLGSYPALIRGGDPSAPTDAGAYEWLNGDESTLAHPLSDLDAHRLGWTRFAHIVGLGFTHILPLGVDHVLFVCGLFLLAGGTRALLLQISAFTVAHSVTLAIAALGIVRVPAAIVEPLIALSIAYVAIENLMSSSLSRWRLAIVFGFGLLHGLGFAGALRDLGVSRPDLPATLVGFNVGVELGQIAVVILAATLVRLLPVPANQRRQWITVPASAAIAAMGIFWAIQRL
jgi:hypothetical protein